MRESLTRCFDTWISVFLPYQLNTIRNVVMFSSENGIIFSVVSAGWRESINAACKCTYLRLKIWWSRSAAAATRPDVVKIKCSQQPGCTVYKNLLPKYLPTYLPGLLPNTLQTISSDHHKNHKNEAGTWPLQQNAPRGVIEIVKNIGKLCAQNASNLFPRY